MKPLAFASFCFVLALVIFLFWSNIVSSDLEFGLHAAAIHRLQASTGTPWTGSGFTLPLRAELAHFLAAMLGRSIGSGLAAQLLVTVAAVFAAHLALLRLTASRSPLFSLLLFAASFRLLGGTGTMVGWEIVGSGRFPQIAATAVYLAALAHIGAGRSPPKRLAAAIAVASVAVYLIEPVVGFHLTVALFIYFAATALCSRVKRGKLSRGHLVLAGSCLLAGAAMSLATIGSPWSPNAVGADAWAPVRPTEPSATILLVGAAFASAAGLAAAALRFPASPAGMAAGAAGCAAAFLFWLQSWLEGSPNGAAAESHVFLLTALGTVNCVRLLSLPFQSRGRLDGWRPVATVLVAGFLSWTVFDRPGTDAREAMAALDFAEHYAAGAPSFRPGNTAARLPAPWPAWLNCLLTVGPLGAEPAAGMAAAQGRPDSAIDYVMVEHASADPACTVFRDKRFAVQRRDCAVSVAGGRVGPSSF